MRVEKTVSYITLVTLVVLTASAFALLPVGSYLSHTHFALTPFLVQFAASATFQVAIAPTVSDYTRYLAERISGGKVSGTVFASLVSAVWLEVLGAILAIAFTSASTVGGFAGLSHRVSPVFEDVVMLVSLLTCLASIAVSFYCGSLAFLTAVEAFKRFVSTFKIRAQTIVPLGVLSVIATLFLTNNVLNDFGVFLSILTYFLIPWTAVNLVDYYIVRKGILSVSDILRPDGGMYGRWGFAGMTSYLVAFAAMVPFFSTSVWEGPAAKALGGADFSFAVGLFVSGGLYYLLARRYDLAAELRIVAQAPINTLHATGRPVTGPMPLGETA